MRNTQNLVLPVYLQLFPARTRPVLQRCVNTRSSGAPDWLYAVQEIGDLLLHLLEGIMAAYIYDALRSQKHKEPDLRDGIKRIAKREIAEYRRELREVEKRIEASESAPKYALTIVERHRILTESLSDSEEAGEVLQRALQRARRTRKRRTKKSSARRSAS